MGTLVGYVIGSFVSLVLLLLTHQRKGRTQAEVDSEARGENKVRLERLEAEREARLQEYSVSWKRRGLLEKRPVAVQPFTPRLVAPASHQRK